jgi:hypothetical protein
LKRRSRGLLPLLIMLQACATLAPPEKSVRVPFEAEFRGVQVSSRIVEGMIELSLYCLSAEPLSVRVDSRRTVIGIREVTRREIVSYREETICEGETCRLVQVPVYREETVHENIYGVIEISPSSFRLEEGQTGIIRLRLVNAAESTRHYTLVVRVFVGDALGEGQLEIACDSQLLLGKTSQGEQRNAAHEGNGRHQPPLGLEPRTSRLQITCSAS